MIVYSKTDFKKKTYSYFKIICSIKSGSCPSFACLII